MKDLIANSIEKLLAKPGPDWHSDLMMEKYGIRNIARAAKRYNRWRYGTRDAEHRKAYESRIAELIAEHGGSESWPPRVIMKDGWAIDTSGTLPGLDRLLEEAGEVVRERGGRIHSDIQQPYFRNLMFVDDLGKYPSWLEFPLSADVLATASYYLETIPVLSKTRPPGLRFMESNQNLDPDPPGPYSASQLYHLDLHDIPLVYVIVLIEDVTPEHGPWTFLPASVSDRAARAIGYQKRGRAYRVTDEEMYRHVDPDEAFVFAYPKGTVLFIDSSRCFHYGSRLSYKPRFQMMYGFTSPCRCDFTQTYMPPFPYPLSEDDSPLRRMVLG